MEYSRIEANTDLGRHRLCQAGWVGPETCQRIHHCIHRCSLLPSLCTRLEHCMCACLYCTHPPTGHKLSLVWNFIFVSVRKFSARGCHETHREPQVILEQKTPQDFSQLLCLQWIKCHLVCLFGDLSVKPGMHSQVKDSSLSRQMPLGSQSCLPVRHSFSNTYKSMKCFHFEFAFWQFVHEYIPDRLFQGMQDWERYLWNWPDTHIGRSRECPGSRPKGDNRLDSGPNIR